MNVRKIMKPSRFTHTAMRARVRQLSSFRSTLDVFA